MTAYLARPRSESPDPHGLTFNERRVVDLLLGGKTQREVALEIGTTYGSVKTLCWSAYRKLGVRSQHELATRLPGRRPERLHAALCRLHVATEALLEQPATGLFEALAGQPLAAEIVVERIDRMIGTLREVRAAAERAVGREPGEAL
jgi:DNA-binding CsgD family transcriptional regulator